ncbi:glycosyltransferase family 4 protein [Candidatus Berkelbacteria bacterium]|nr:glycosyltransferase family 4 protein [Candidatus Berkelbacteria bacterium]
MKILVLSRYYSPVVGGAELVAQQLAEEMARRGHQMTVVTGSETARHNHQLNGVTVVCLPSFHPKQISIESRKLFERDMEAILEQSAPDALHGHNMALPFDIDRSLVAFRLSQKFQIPFILHAHDAQAREPEKTQKIAQLRWGKIVTVSQYGKDAYLRQGANQATVQVIYNAVDPDAFHPRVQIQHPLIRSLKEQLGGRLSVLFPGRLASMSTGKYQEQKRFRTVLRALPAIVEQYPTIMLLAPVNRQDVPSEQLEKTLADFRHEIVSLGLKNHVLFIEQVAHEFVPQLLQLAQISCLPSFRESFGIAHVEAMSMEKIVFAGNSGGPKEIITHGKTGYLVDSDDHEGLARILCKIIETLPAQKGVGRAARTSVLQRFSIGRQADQFEAIYREVIQRGVFV